MVSSLERLERPLGKYTTLYPVAPGTVVHLKDRESAAALVPVIFDVLSSIRVTTFNTSDQLPMSQELLSSI